MERYDSVTENDYGPMRLMRRYRKNDIVNDILVYDGHYALACYRAEVECRRVSRLLFIKLYSGCPNLVPHPRFKQQICFVLSAVRVTIYCCLGKAVREVKICRGIIEHRVYREALANIKREFNASIDLRLIQAGPVFTGAPLRNKVFTDVFCIRGNVSERVKLIATKLKIDLISNFNPNSSYFVLVADVLDPEMINPFSVVEGLVNSSVAIDDPRSPDAGRV